MSKKSNHDIEKLKQFATRNKTGLLIGGAVVLVLVGMSDDNGQAGGYGDDGYTQPGQVPGTPYDGGYTQTPYQGGGTTTGPSSSDESWARQEERSRAAQDEWERQEEITRRNDEIGDKVILDQAPVICYDTTTGETIELPHGYSCP